MSNNEISNQEETPPQTKRITKSIFDRVSCGIKLVDDLINQFYSSITASFDSIIQEVDIPRFLKKILFSKQLLFYFVFILNFCLIYFNIKLDYSDSDKDNLFYFQILIKKILFYSFLIFALVIGCFILILKFRNTEDSFLNRDEELEKHILIKYKELQNNFCNVCKVTKCMRSFHCNVCNRCVVKYEFHSDWFNTCIMSQNNFVYVIILIFLNLNFVSVLLNCLIQIFYFGRTNQLYDFSGKELIYHFWNIILLYLFIKLFKFTKNYIENCFIKNLTYFETQNWKRLPYLWYNMRKDFFNPFDKGVNKNLNEIWISFLNREISLKEKINMKIECNRNLNKFDNNYSNLNETIENITNNHIEKDDEVLININKKENENNSKSIDLDSNQLFITKCNKQIYREYYGSVEDILNWTKVRFYSIFDLKNSPFREIVKKQMEVNKK